MKHLPRITARRDEGDALTLDFTLDNDCPWLEGHFPGNPILPGVVQVGWAAHHAAVMVGSDRPPLQILRLKFTHPVVPVARLTLKLARQGQRVAFEYLLHVADEAVRASSGLFDFAEAP